MERTSDYQGWTNWDTWHAKLLIDNEQALYRASRKIVEQGINTGQTDEQIGQVLEVWALPAVIGPSNARQIADAQEWNDIPQEERIDQDWEETNKKTKGLLNQFIGPDIEDYQPMLMQNINWYEIAQHIREDILEERRYERGLPPSWQEPKPDLDAPGDLTMPEHWGASEDSWDPYDMYAVPWEHRRPFTIDFSNIDHPNPPIWIGKGGENHPFTEPGANPYLYHGEIWDHVSPPIIQGMSTPNNVYDGLAKAHIERVINQQEGVKERTSSDGQSWGQEQGQWSAPLSQETFDVDVPGEAPGMPRNMETGGVICARCGEPMHAGTECPVCGFKKTAVTKEEWDEWSHIINSPGAPDVDGTDGRYPYLVTPDEKVYIGPNGGSHEMINRQFPETVTPSNAYGEIYHPPGSSPRVRSFSWGENAPFEQRVLDAYNRGERMPGTWKDWMHLRKSNVEELLDHDMINEHLKQQQEAQEVIQDAKQQKRQQDAQWPSMGLKKASDDWDEIFTQPDYGRSGDTANEYHKFIYSPGIPGKIHDWTQDYDDDEPEWLDTPRVEHGDYRDPDFLPTHNEEARKFGLIREEGQDPNDSYSPGIVTVRPDHVAIGLHALAPGHDEQDIKNTVGAYYKNLYPNLPVLWGKGYFRQEAPNMRSDYAGYEHIASFKLPGVGETFLYQGNLVQVKESSDFGVVATVVDDPTLDYWWSWWQWDQARGKGDIQERLAKVAADNVPGMPVQDSGHWIWLDGKVGMGGTHHDIAASLARDLGYSDADTAYISNWIARGHCPLDKAVAIGIMNGKYPQILNSTRDRNAVFDAVMRHLDASAD